MACGRFRAHRCSPNARTDSAWIHSAPGSLSMLIEARGSNAAKKKLCQLMDIDRTAAA